MLQLLETARISQGAFKTDGSGDRRDRKLGVAQEFFGFIDPEFRNILVDRDPHMFLKQLTEIIF